MIHGTLNRQSPRQIQNLAGRAEIPLHRAARRNRGSGGPASDPTVSAFSILILERIPPLICRLHFHSTVKQNPTQRSTSKGPIQLDRDATLRDNSTL
jgi:uncharacterized protein YjiK